MIERAKAADPEASEAEWGGGFRNDISGFLDDATIEGAIDYGRPLQLPPLPSGQSYKAFVDASGGRSDHYTVAIGHRRDGRYIVDCIHGRAPPFDPGWTTKELADLCKRYNIHEVTGDNFSQEWCQQAWSHNGLSYRVSELTKGGLYLEALPLFTQGLVSLPDHPQLIRELRLLERRTHRSGRDTIDHGRSGSDDYSNAVAGLLYTLSKSAGYDLLYADEVEQEPAQWQHDSWRERRLKEIEAENEREAARLRRYAAPVTMPRIRDNNTIAPSGWVN